MNTIELFRQVRQDPARHSCGHGHINHMREWPFGWLVATSFIGMWREG